MLVAPILKGEKQMTAPPKYRYTLEQYLELDRNSETRLEYWNGEVLVISDEADQQGRIEENLIFPLGWQPKSKACRLFASTMRIKVPCLQLYRYADLSAVCGLAEFEEIGGVEVLTNPQLIVEITSTVTEANDHGDKFSHYKSIPSFIEYLLIAQHRPHISQYVKLNTVNRNQAAKAP
ncbi:MAG: Uma2 family endonuclease [Acidobacteria bacterium]|nr:Uma2 family endonuclease [Acidobacteriota bacterium]